MTIIIIASSVYIDLEQKVNLNCFLEMPDKDNNFLKYNHGEKSVKVPFVIYVDTES